MTEDIFIQISNRIREKRKEKNITMQELADKANVSKGLISQVENGRTVPSLMVLIDIVRSLDIDLTTFFKNMQNDEEPVFVVLKKHSDYEPVDMENGVDFAYRRIFSPSINKGSVEIMLVELKAYAQHPIRETAALEYVYLLNGGVNYTIDRKTYTLEKGDSLLFDGLSPHSFEAMNHQPATILRVSFIESKGK